jgi:hypothetical protein
MTRSYQVERDILTVKGWMLNLAEMRGMGYVDQGNTVSLTFPEDYKIPTKEEVKPDGDVTKQHRKRGPRGPSGHDQAKS